MKKTIIHVNQHKRKAMLTEEEKKECQSQTTERIFEITSNHGRVIEQLIEAHDGLVDNSNDIFESIEKRFAALEEKVQILGELTETVAAVLFMSLGSDLPQEKLDELQRHAEATGAILPDLVMDFITRDKPRH